MRRHRRNTRRRTSVRAGVLVLCSGLVVGAWALRPAEAVREAARPTEQALPAPRHPAVAPIIGAEGSGPAARRAVDVPVRLRIPAIGVTTALQRLELEHDGSMQPPSAWGVAGWYAGGPRPGQVGPAVVVGHIDSTAGPAVFYRLADLRLGDAVLVTERDGHVQRWVVDDIVTFAKARFPTWRIYGPQPLPVLRLITCTGAFDAAARSYVDNLVVSAHLADGTS